MIPVPTPIGYAVDVLGNVYSLNNRWGRRKTPRLVAQAKDRDGYMRVELYQHGKKKKYPVHRLILEAFIGLCPIGMECRHLDGNPSNNRLENLCWGTYKENEVDKIVHGTRLLGENLPWTKLTMSQVICIKKRIQNGDKQTEIAAEFGVSPRIICDIKFRKSWRYV